MTVTIPMVDLPSGARRILGSLQSKERSLPLESVQLRARVADRVAEVAVEQKFGNPFAEAIEAVYVFPLAGGSAVSRFEMQIGGRTVRGVLQERAEARRNYALALEQGKRAALLEQERDDVFTVQVGNIAPGEAVTVRLTYSERLPFFEDGRTELRLPLVVAPRYVAGDDLQRDQAGHGVANDTTTVPDASRITPPRLVPGFDPRVALSIEVELFGGFADLACSQHAVRTASGPESAKVALAREREPLDRDFVLRWRLAGEKVEPKLLVNGEYAMVSLLPPLREGFIGLARDVVFVLDRSGSMQGAKMASAARACALLLRTLAPRDRFAVQAFDNVVEWMPGGLHAADEGAIDRGERWLRTVEARGGTELGVAVREALAILAARQDAAGRVAAIVVLTDGQVGDESGVLQRVQTGLGDARVFTVGIDTAVNDGFLRRLAGLGGGTSSFVEPGARLEEALEAVGREIGTPLLTSLRLEGEVGAIAPARLPDLFAGRASAAFLRLRGGAVKVSGRWPDGSAYSAELKPQPAPLAAIEHLWARARVADLEDEFRATRAEALKREIVALSIRHGVLTRFTAFVVVDDEVVNEGGSRRTVVQPVATPESWEMPAAVTRSAGRMLSMEAAPAMKAAMPPVRAMAGAAQLMKKAFAGRAVLQPPGRPQPPPERATPAQLEKVRLALDAFLAAFTAAKDGKGGADGLEAARVELLRALGEALPIATSVPLLQAFLRSGALEVIAALRTGAADAALFERNEKALLRARDEARAVLAGGASFWEASI